jgi:hypothetical protein
MSAARLESLFIRSSYITCFAAAACLVWSEFGLLLQVESVAIVASLLIVLAYALEGRWALTARTANVAGAGIMALAGLWIAFQWVHSSQNVLYVLPWPTSLVPLAGPILLLLLVAKLLRPKSISDHWAVQGMALLCVGLGCTLADDATFVVLMALYCLSALWCLAVFFVYREHLRDSGTPQPIQLPPMRQIASWLFPVVFLALLGFFALPRSDGVWQIPGKKKTDVGISEEQLIDLNNTGTLELDPEVAFEVYLEDYKGNPKTNLSANQRWRGPIFRTYSNGNWRRGVGGPRVMGIGSTIAAEPQLQAREPGLPTTKRSDQFTATFTVKSRIGPVPFLYDPVYTPPGRDLSVIELLPNGRTVPWRLSQDGLLTAGRPVTPGKTRYRQICVPGPAPNLSHPVNIDSGALDLSALTTAPPLPNLKAWTESLLARLAREGSLPREAIEARAVTGEIDPRFFETIAQALENFLSRSGEYTYSLILDRSDPSLDPVEDFLYNTKSGHCNRFTTALAVMLRTLRIPCQVVLGYLGVDSRGDGRYEVRQCNAHSWVEVLVPHQNTVPAPGMFVGDLSWHWLVLDPTPAEAVAQAEAVSSRWWSSGFNLQQLLNDLIINYDSENRDELAFELWQRTKAAAKSLFVLLSSASDEGLRARIVASLVLLTLSAMGFLVRQLIRRRRASFARELAQRGIDFHVRLLRLLAQRGLTPSTGQTSREFAHSVAPHLEQRQDGHELNQVVRTTSELYYRVRFGQLALNPDERRQLKTRLDWLEEALAKPTD